LHQQHRETPNLGLQRQSVHHNHLPQPLQSILCAPYVNKSDKHQLTAYDSIMHRLTNRGHNINLQIMDNEVSTEFKATIVDKWKVRYQLIPLNVHHHNPAKRAIQTFKSHFLAIIAGLPPALPYYLWDLLLPQTKLTLNLLRQSSITPSMSAWEHFNGPHGGQDDLILSPKLIRIAPENSSF
jgi:hypothetical protein